MQKDRFIKKMMRLAREVGTYDNPCYSRKIGVVICDKESNRVLGTGYNGPPPGTPHCDDPVFLSEYFWPQLTDDDKEGIRLAYGRDDDPTGKEFFISSHAFCGTCPRKLVGAKSGERSELCSCGHAERHAITNATCDLRNTVMFCWCGVPCLQCTDAIIQAGINEIHCLKWEADYHPAARWLLEEAGVLVVEHDERIFDE